jgi:phage repressor protein C with HTH and peptisase S24 domain
MMRVFTNVDFFIISALSILIFTILIMKIKKKYYVFKVIGSSMEPTFRSGETLLVKETSKYEFGDIVIANINYPKNKNSPKLVVK